MWYILSTSLAFITSIFSLAFLKFIRLEVKSGQTLALLGGDITDRSEVRGNGD